MIPAEFENGDKHDTVRLQYFKSCSVLRRIRYTWFCKVPCNNACKKSVPIPLFYPKSYSAFSMEQAVQQVSDEHSQRASEHTNPFTSSELKANTKHNDWCNTQSKITQSSSISTNAFTTSEINASTTYNKECNTPITNIQSSNDTNPFTASELKANINHNRECATQPKSIPSSNNTSPLTASELDAILKQANAQLERGPSSGITNPIASTELKAMVKHNKELDTRPEKSATNDGGEKTTTSHNNTIDDKDSDKQQIGIQTPCRQRIRRAILKFNLKTVVSINAQAIGISGTQIPPTAGELVLIQSQHDVGYSIQIAALPQDQRRTRRSSQGKIVSLSFMFDPSSDFILLCNSTKFTTEPIVIRPLPLSCRSEPLKLEPLGKVPLNSSYGIYAWNEHLFDLTILPRCYISMVETPSQMARTNKRTLEPSSSQPGPSKAKRAKLKETTDESNATTIIQTTAQPQPPPPPPANKLVAVKTISNTDNPETNIVSGICHPLEHLRLGDTVKIISATQEEDYTVTRKDDISVQTNSIVFKAHHSSFSDKSIAVKVWRSKLDYDLNSKKGVNISTVGKHWLNEVKNHFKVSQHVS